MGNETGEHLKQKYLDQLNRARAEMGRHPVSGIDPRASNRCRIGVKVEMFHQQPAGQPTVLNSVFHRWLESAEQPFERHLAVTDKWQQLEYGWLPPEGVGMLTLRNIEGFYQVVPTPEERTEVEERVIELAIRLAPGGHFALTQENKSPWSVGDDHDRDFLVTPFARIRPGECCQFEPANLEHVAVRCRRGKAKAVLLLCPA